MSTPDLLPAPRPQFAVDGETKASLARDLLMLRAHEDERGVRTFEARFANWGARDDGTTGFLYFDGAVLGLGRRLDASAGPVSAEASIFSGPITAIAASFDQGGTPAVTVLAEDDLVRLRMGQRSRVFESATDGDIAGQVAEGLSLQSDAAATGATHVQLWQVNQTDLGLLRERARAADARVTLDDRTLRFVPRANSAGGDPTRLTRLNELLHFEVMADLAHQRTAVVVHGWSVADKDGIHERADDGALGSESNGNPTGASVLDELGWEAVEHLHLEAPATVEEARGLAEAAFRERARRFVAGRGVTTGSPALRVGGEVELLDLGPWFSGVYRLTSVTHCWDLRSGLRTRFVARRPNLGEEP